MEKLPLKKCYICLPIAGQEDSVFERAEKAKIAIKKIGMEPVCPLECNGQNKDNIDTHENNVGEFMGNDIRTLINDCDAIYMCDGWKDSKGCNVEYECAKQYNKIKFFETIPNDEPLRWAIADVRAEFYWRYRHLNEEYGPASLEVSLIKKEMDEFNGFVKKFFNID